MGLFFFYLLAFGPDHCRSRVSGDGDVQTQFVASHHHDGGLCGAAHAVQVDLGRVFEGQTTALMRWPELCLHLVRALLEAGARLWYLGAARNQSSPLAKQIKTKSHQELRESVSLSKLFFYYPRN